MSRRTPLFCLALAVMCLFLTAPKTNGQRVYGISYIQGDPNTRQIDGYSATWLDYNAAYYYDPAVLGELYDDVGLANEHPLDSGYTEGFGIYPAEIFTNTSLYRPNTRYHLYSTHFIRAYYFYSSCSGFFGGCSFDPFGFSRFFSGTGGGNGNWLGSGFQNLYVQSRRYTLGTTHVTIVTPPDALPTPTATPIATPSPCTPGANTPCPPDAFILSLSVDPPLILPAGTGSAAASHRATVTVTAVGLPSQTGRPVSLALVAAPDTGGHIDAHHTGPRPLGRLAATHGTINANGEFQTTYFANHLSQTVTIRLTYNNSQTREVNINTGVSGLERLYDGTNFYIVGDNTAHPDNHNGTADANRNLHRIADDYKQEYYGAGVIPEDDKLRYNDQSLPFGGKFDLGPRRTRVPNWSDADSHDKHREGLNCDVKSGGVGPGIVPRDRWVRLTQIFGERGFSVGDETASANHWHLSYTGGQPQAAVERAAPDYIDSTWWASLDRQPNDDEWRDRLAMLESAQAQGAMPTLDAARGLNRALFQSVEYAMRQRGDEDYVTDLYATYMLREADAGGFNYWLGRLRSDNAQGLNGRETLLGAFAGSQEFVDIVTRLYGTAPPHSCNPAERQQCINNGGIWDPDTCTCTVEPDPCLGNPNLCR